MELAQQQIVYSNVVQKAWESAEFKKDLIANPLETFEKFTGHKFNLPEGKSLVIKDENDELENDDSKIYLVIPTKQDIDNIILTEEQLEAVAGGIFTTPVCVYLAAVTAMEAIGCIAAGATIYAAVK
jgi:hypothetical protein